MTKVVLASLCLFATVRGADAAIITFTDVQLASGNPVTVDGTTLTTLETGGSINFVEVGEFTGLSLGLDNNPGGFYTLAFSSTISSIEIEFDALSNGGGSLAERLFNFQTNNGPVTIGYTNQFGTTFDGTVITSTDPNGQGIITFAGPSFDWFSFSHAQGQQSGFVIERIVINTVAQQVPEPATLSLLGFGLAGMGVRRWRQRKA